MPRRGSQCYVDNAQNRRLGRVGKAYGTHVVHQNGTVTVKNPQPCQRQYTPPTPRPSRCTSSGQVGQGCYVDNEQNRRLGRVGKAYGAHVVHQNGTVTVKNPQPCQRQYTPPTLAMKVMTPSKCSSGKRISSPKTTGQVGQGCYVDNEQNRRLGRVGKVYGTHVLHQDGTVTGKNPQPYGCWSTTPPPAQPRHREPQPVYLTQLRPAKTEAKRPVINSHRFTTAPGRSKVPSSGITTTTHQAADIPTTSSPKVASEIKHEEEVCKSKSDPPRAPPSDGDRKPIPRGVPTQHTDSPEDSTLIQVLRKWQQFVEIGTTIGLTQPASSQLKVAKRNNPILTHLSPVIPFTELRLESVIGSGSYGEVHKGTWKGRPIAYKKLLFQQIMTRKRKQRFSAEITILAALDHPNTVRMFGIVDEEGKYGIVMEYLVRTLHRAILIDDTEFPKEKKKKVVSQIASALVYLHTYNDGPISHGDLKSANILLDEKDNAKLGDFGMSTLKKATSSSQSTVGGVTHGGTPRYSAPEVLRGDILTIKQRLQADIYSLSIIVFEVIVEEEPFEDLDEQQLRINVGNGKMHPPVEELWESVAGLLIRCWSRDAEKRPTAEEFLKKWDLWTLDLSF